jgi:dUTP pyrophosphatase
MENIIGLKVKKLYENVPTPKYATNGSAGLDLTAMSRIYDKNGNVCYGTGIAVEIPEGYVGLLFPRSSITKKDIFVKNSVGVIDSDYRGEIILKCAPCLGFANYDNNNYNRYGISTDQDYFESITYLSDNEFDHYDIGDKCCQLVIVPIPKVVIHLVDELSETERGAGGYGHTGK